MHYTRADTLESIAERYELSISQLTRYNNLVTDKVEEGKFSISLCPQIRWIMIELLKTRYGWEEAIIDRDGLVQTNRGLKRIHYWQDLALMKWHIDWRDSCNVTPYVIMDRMLRTIDGAAYVQFDDYMVTVHDEIKDPYGQIGHEENWGCFLGRMIECGRKQKVKKKWEKPHFEQLNERVINVAKEHRNQINGFIREAQKRTTNVFKLIGDNEVDMP